MYLFARHLYNGVLFLYPKQQKEGDDFCNINISHAERAYYSRHKKRIENEEERLWKIAEVFNEIDKLIGKLSTSKDYIRACNEISVFAEVIGKDATEILKLKHKLKDKVSDVMTEYDDKLENINHDISVFQSIEITDTPEEARDLQQLATTKMYEYMMQLNRDENTNKRQVGNWIKGKLLLILMIFSMVL